MLTTSLQSSMNAIKQHTLNKPFLNWIQGKNLSQVLVEIYPSANPNNASWHIFKQAQRSTKLEHTPTCSAKNKPGLCCEKVILSNIVLTPVPGKPEGDYILSSDTHKIRNVFNELTPLRLLSILPDAAFQHFSFENQSHKCFNMAIESTNLKTHVLVCVFLYCLLFPVNGVFSGIMAAWQCKRKGQLISIF